MKIETFIKVGLTPGLSLLPERMDSPQGRAMLLAIGLQESRFEHRKQIGGPARGYFQFEQGGGINGVLTHPSTAKIITGVCAELDITPDMFTCYDAVAYNDPLAVCFARLLLWTLPSSLAAKAEPKKGWLQYISAWRPGKPKPDTWDDYFNQAWEAVEGV